MSNSVNPVYILLPQLWQAYVHGKIVSYFLTVVGSWILDWALRTSVWKKVIFDILGIDQWTRPWLRFWLFTQTYTITMQCNVIPCNTKQCNAIQWKCSRLKPSREIKSFIRSLSYWEMGTNDWKLGNDTVCISFSFKGEKEQKWDDTA